MFNGWRASAEQERAHLLARRVRDEFWYADRFGLTWPRLHSAPFPASSATVGQQSQDAGQQAAALEFTPAPTPSEEPKRRLVLLFGYWPPTDIGVEGRPGMLSKWSTLQKNYKEKGFDVLAITPTFDAKLGWSDPEKTIPFWGKGAGQLTVDYRNTSKDFWSIVQDRLPVAIMSFSRGVNDKSWVLEGAARNLKQATWIKELPYMENDGTEKN